MATSKSDVRAAVETSIQDRLGVSSGVEFVAKVGGAFAVVLSEDAAAKVTARTDPLAYSTVVGSLGLGNDGWDADARTLRVSATGLN